MKETVYSKALILVGKVKEWVKRKCYEDWKRKEKKRLIFFIINAW